MIPTITFENRDCMEAMKEFPDNFFDLAITDPPYGGGFTEGGGCKGWFTEYHQPLTNNTHTHTHTLNNRLSDSADDSTSTSGSPKIGRTGGTWAAKYGKKLWRGI